MWVHYSCMKVKKGFCNADYAAKNAPPFCEIWFVNKGKHIWTREATENAVNFLPTMVRASKAMVTEGLRTKPSLNRKNETIIDPTCSFTTSRSCEGVVRPDQQEVAVSASGSVSRSSLTPNSSVTSSGYTPIEIRRSSGFDSNAEEEMLGKKLIEATTEAEKARDEAFAELLERRRLESESVETVNKVVLTFYS